MDTTRRKLPFVLEHLKLFYSQKLFICKKVLILFGLVFKSAAWWRGRIFSCTNWDMQLKGLYHHVNSL